MMAQLITITLLCLTSVFPKYAIKATNLSLLKLFSTTRKKKRAFLKNAEDYWYPKETNSAGAS